MQTELRRHFYSFIVFAGLVAIILFSLPFIKPKLAGFVTSLFDVSETQKVVDNPVPGGNQPNFASPNNSDKQEIHLNETAASLFETIFRLFQVILWMALVIAVVRFFSNLIFVTALRKTTNVEIATLLRNVLSIIIYVAAFVTIFKSLFPGTDLSTFFAGSTIIGVVIGLALQDTLGNLFAGLAMQADQQFQIGDVLDIKGKATGTVESISWRGVKIRTFQNKLVVVSNSILGREFIEVAPKDNLNARFVYFNTIYSASPSKTAHLIREVVRHVENVSTKMRPVVRIQSLGESSLDWEVKFWLDDYARFNDTEALIRQRIWYAFQRESIHFAFPIRTIYHETQSLEPNFTESVDLIFERLSEIAIFAPLTDEETQKLAENCEAKVFSANEIIVKQGHQGTSMYIVHRGSVTIQITDSGASKTINTLHEGDFFGEMGLFTGAPRTANVVASEETEVLEIKHTAIKPLFEKNPHLAEALSQIIAERRTLILSKNEDKQELLIEKETVFSSLKKFFGLS